MPRAEKRPANVPQPTAPITPSPITVVSVSKVTPDLTVGRPELEAIYDKVEMTEYSSMSKKGPLTVEQVKTILGWETEPEYKKRMVEENPNSKPEHHLFGETGPRRSGTGQFQPIHCINTKKEKVVCWNNANNRPFDMGWCEDLIHTILHGQWAGPLTIPGETINGETVRISRYGRVLSGQHQGTALVLSDEYLQKARTNPSYSDNPKFPAWDDYDHCVIETIVITGLSEDERVLRSIDYVKPRSLADMLYTTRMFRNKPPKERQELTKMLAAGANFLYDRTATKGYKTHTEMAEFLNRHKRLLDCVDHLFNENTPLPTGGRRISKLRISAGHAAAMCYLMACGSQKTTDYSDEYRNESPPSERNLDWSYWDRAQDFWTCLAIARDFMPVRTALMNLIDSSLDNEDNQGLSGRAGEKLAILAKAWERFKDHPPTGGPPFDDADLEPDGLLSLSYSDLDDKGNKLPEKQIKLVDIADFYGIDCPSLTKSGTSAVQSRGNPDPPAPVGDEYERLKEDALRRRQAT